MQSKLDDTQSHAALAMKAAREVARARRRSQKEKMGRVVCHHLLLMLNAESELSAPRMRPRLERIRAEPFEDKQISLAF